MWGSGRKIAAAAVAFSLCAVPTAALGANPSVRAAAATPGATAPVSPWLTLSAMTTSSSAATTAALRHEEGHAGFPPLPVLAVILATIAVAIWILVDDDDGRLGISPD
jgi:hypothetical protein